MSTIAICWMIHIKMKSSSYQRRYGQMIFFTRYLQSCIQNLSACRKSERQNHTAVILTLLLLEEQFSQQVIERDENSRTYDSEKVCEVMHGLQAVNDYTRLMSINN